MILHSFFDDYYQEVVVFTDVEKAARDCLQEKYIQTKCEVMLKQNHIPLAYLLEVIRHISKYLVEFPDSYIYHSHPYFT